MGMSVGGGGNTLNSDPNVVPMIDIMLVLLIIFMMMQPLLRKAIDLQLPDPTPSTAPANAQSNQIVLEVKSDGTFAVNTQPVPHNGLAQKLKDIYEGRPDKIIFIKGDPTVHFQEVISAMDVVRGAGVKVIGVPPKDTK